MADLDDDGVVEIVNGPYWYRAPADGVYAGPWRRYPLAPSYREMTRAALADVTGNGSLDVILCESEYPNGRLCWYENRFKDCPEQPWREHAIDEAIYYGHSLEAWRDSASGRVHFFLGEMAHGGYWVKRNHNARLLEYVSEDGGQSWRVQPIDQASGTHEACVSRRDEQGAAEIVGKQWQYPKVQLWRRRPEKHPIQRYQLHVLDRDKPYTSTDIMAVDVDGDGLEDIVTGAWWYHQPDWQRYEIPGVNQVITAYDIDGDGRKELIGTTRREGVPPHEWYKALTSELIWLKPIDPLNGRWQQAPIGTGAGDWPHGSLVAPLLPDGGLALVVGYHSAQEHSDHHPELFEIPTDPTDGPWPKRPLAEIPYGEEFAVADINGNGRLDIVAGRWWLENKGEGSFLPHVMIGEYEAARVAVGDLTGNGRVEVLIGEERLDFKTGVTPLSRLTWLEQPADPAAGPWSEHVIDRVRCPHSVAMADIDGDGELEVICGEHDPSITCRTRSKLFVYKKESNTENMWVRYLLDDRFEHHDGCRLIQMAGGRVGLISHGWADRRYVLLFTWPAE